MKLKKVYAKENKKNFPASLFIFCGIILRGRYPENINITINTLNSHLPQIMKRILARTMNSIIQAGNAIEYIAHVSDYHKGNTGLLCFYSKVQICYIVNINQSCYPKICTVGQTLHPYIKVKGMLCKY